MTLCAPSITSVTAARLGAGRGEVYLNSTVPYSTVQYSTVQYSTVQYSVTAAGRGDVYLNKPQTRVPRPARPGLGWGRGRDTGR